MGIFKLQIVALLLLVSFLSTLESAQAQLDLGRLIEGRAQEVVQNLENRIRGELQNGLPQILPHQPRPSPVEILPYPPFPQNNQPITNPTPFPSNPYPTHPIPAPYPVQQFPGETIIQGPVQPIGQPLNQPGVSTVPLRAVSNPQPAVKTSARKPTVAKKKLPKVEAAEIVNLSTKKYGAKAGKVYLKIGKLVLNAKVLNWSNDRVQARLPYMPMKNSAEAIVLVSSPENRLLDKAEIELAPSSKPAPAVGKTVESAAKPKPPTVTSGQRLHIKGELGEAKGSVELRLGGMKLPARIVDWNAAKVNFDLPTVTLTKPQNGQIVVLKADGVPARSVNVRLPGSAE